MNTRQTALLTALTAFAGGFLAGMLFAPASGRDARRRIATSAQDSTRWLGDRLHDLEAQLGTLEQQIQQTGAQFSERVRGAAQKAVDPYLPTFPDEDTAWKVDRKELAKDLRRMPRK